MTSVNLLGAITLRVSQTRRQDTFYKAHSSAQRPFPERLLSYEKCKKLRRH